VERGIQANPDRWKLYYELGFLQYMELHDSSAAARAFDRGSKIPGAHPFLKVLAAAMAQHAGESQMARMLWSTTYQTTEDQMIRDNAFKHLRALDVDEVVPKLERVITQYKLDLQREPASWSDLVQAGYLRRVPLDPLGNAYKLMPDGRVEVADPDALPFIKHGLPPGRKAEVLVIDRS